MFIPETDPSLKEAIVADMSQAPPRIALGALKELLTYDTTSALQRVHAPIRCINSDKYTTHIDRARKYAPNFDAFLIKEAGHFLMMEKPDEFNRVLSDVIEDVVKGEDSDPNAKRNSR
jgi:pimeloyl-ACP methyl ester carboxylesterase